MTMNALLIHVTTWKKSHGEQMDLDTEANTAYGSTCKAGFLPLGVSDLGPGNSLL